MSDVYAQRPLAPDQRLGHVEADGRVFRSQLGPDSYAGRIELETGRVFRTRLGPDEYAGHVDLPSGRIYRQVALGPDDLLGHVDAEGRVYRNRLMAPDEYVGRLEGMKSYAEAGAALLLLFE